MKKPLALALASALSMSAPIYAEEAAVDAKPAAASVLPSSNPFAAVVGTRTGNPPLNTIAGK